MRERVLAFSIVVIVCACAAVDDSASHGEPGFGKDSGASGGVGGTAANASGPAGSGGSDLDFPSVDPCKSAQEGQSAIGCEFYPVYPDVYDMSDGACYAVFVANTASEPLTITVSYDNTTLDTADFARIPVGSGKALTYQGLPGGQVPVNEVAILFLARHNSTPCPAGVKPPVPVAAVDGTGIGRAFRITTSAPVAMYDAVPYGGSDSGVSSASLLLPTSAWGTNYVAVNAFPKGLAGQPTMALVAADDGTEVVITPKVDIVAAPDVAAAPAGSPHTYLLARGQVLQITQDSELTGSVIQANKPIGMVGGQTCLNVDVNDGDCDADHKWISPVSALGSEYVAVRYRSRHAGEEESTPWRVVGTVDGTTLSYEPAAPEGAPSVIGKGEVASFWSLEPFVITSQDDAHPFFLAGYMTGRFYPPAPYMASGPEFLNALPAAQYQDSYVFFTDPTYPETNLVFVRPVSQDRGTQDVTLDCLGAVSGWASVGSRYEYARVDLQTADFEKVGTCDNGRHKAHSSGTFGLVVWGWTNGYTLSGTSYAYPGGAGTKRINDVVVK